MNTVEEVERVKVQYATVLFMQDGRAVMTAFEGEGRLERALAYAQGLLDEHRFALVREEEVLS